MRSFTICASAFTLAAVAHAAPQKTVMPFKPGFVNATLTATTAFPPKPTEVSCQADCQVRYPELQAVSWIRKDQINYYTTVTVGTVSVITTISGNSTLKPTTRTVQGYVDPQYDLWSAISTNEAGTAYIEIASSLPGAGYSRTKLTYPTPYLDYPSAYHWTGVLSTSSACVTATDFEFGELTAHPQYPQPKTATPYDGDYVGAAYTPIRIGIQELPDKSWFDAQFPSVPAFASCTSVRGKIPGPDLYAPKFVYDTTSLTSIFMSKSQAIHVQPSTDGFEISSKPDKSIEIPPPLRTELSFEDTSTVFPAATPTPTLMSPKPTLSNPPQTAVQSLKPSGGNANLPDRPEITPPPPPIFTPPPTGSILIPTIIDGKPTASPGFVVPGSLSTASIGQTIIVDGRPTVVAPPPATFTVIPTTVNGVATSAPAFIIGGTSTASIGQTVTINGQTTVLSAPAPLFTMLPTTINGQPTSVPGYIVNGATTATLGQTVSIGGVSTVLNTPAPYLTMIRTTVNGVATSVTAYIISGTSTAFPGQTVTLNGKSTVLPDADFALIYVPTTINGVATSVPAYIISGTSTAFPGQTITMDGESIVLPDHDVVLSSITTTILGRMTKIPVYIISGSITATAGQVVTLAGKTTMLPTLSTTLASDGSSSFGGPASTALGGARETGKKDSGENIGVSLGALLGGVACALFCVG